MTPDYLFEYPTNQFIIYLIEKSSGIETVKVSLPGYE